MSKKENEVLEEKEKNFESELVYDGFYKIEKITRKSDEKEVSGEVIRRGNTVVGLIFNTITKKYIFIEKYKLAANGVTLETIQGDVEDGEKPQQTIKRLVTEMTGYKVDNSNVLTSYFMDTNNSDEICTLYHVEVSEKVVDDLEFDDYKLIEIEKMGLGGKLFIEDPINMMNLDLTGGKEKEIKPPYQSLDIKSLVAIMWVENNNMLRDIAEVITNSKIRSL